MHSNVINRVEWFTLLIGMAAVMALVSGCPDTTPDDGGTQVTQDADGDGVVDVDDLCADTPGSETVDADGCAASQRDSDGDGVNDDTDNCADTPADTEVDDNGCELDPPPGLILDGDGDGVADANDDCADTPAEAVVDDSGCAATQRDSDGDGVSDDIDECADTPNSVDVDDVGCPVSEPGTPDDDGDGVANDIDQCDDTADGADVDANGCATEQLDSDGDGVTNDVDECSETPEDATDINDVGCAASERDSDRDGVTDDIDDCPGTSTGTSVNRLGCPTGGGPPPPPPPPPDSTCGDGTLDSGEECDDGNLVGGDGCRTDCTIEECGDGIVDPREDCDPPNGETCDDRCAIIASGSFDADDCADATAMSGEGAFTFDNTNATLDGPPHTACVEFTLDQIELDMWGCWTAPCSATAFIKTCELTDIDTKIAVYAGCDCPVTDANLVACNDDTCDVQSLATFQATAGEQYLIRIGSFPDDPPIGGAGAVSITCGLDACPGIGECTAENDTPGCSDQSCCETVCAADPYCCDSEWDDVCVQEAEGYCGTGFAACGRGAGSCTAANGSPGCDDGDCCNAICRDDSFCCVSEWDDICATAEAATCFSTCTAEAGECSGTNSTPGCNDTACCAEVCPRDAFCCDPDGGEWDENCAELAAEHCTQ